MSGVRTFVLVANRARADGDVPLDDLPGLGGRFDLVARFVNAALLTSHGIREDTQVIVVFTQPEEPIALRVDGAAVTGVGPDERSTAARLACALGPVPMPVWQEAAEGMQTRSGSFAELIEELPDPVVLLHGDGQESLAELEEGTFVVGDHEGFTDEQLAVLRKRAGLVAGLGPRSLQADHVATIVHHELDR